MMQVDFDLGRLSDTSIEQLLYSLVEAQSQDSPFSDAICQALSRESQRRMNGGEGVCLALPPIERVNAMAIVSRLLAVKTATQAAARKAGEISRENLSVEIEFIIALIAAVRGAAIDRLAASGAG